MTTVLNMSSAAPAVPGRPGAGTALTLTGGTGFADVLSRAFAAPADHGTAEGAEPQGAPQAGPSAQQHSAEATADAEGGGDELAPAQEPVEPRPSEESVELAPTEAGRQPAAEGPRQPESVPDESADTAAAPVAGPAGADPMPNRQTQGTEIEGAELQGAGIENTDTENTDTEEPARLGALPGHNGDTGDDGATAVPLPPEAAENEAEGASGELQPDHTRAAPAAQPAPVLAVAALERAAAGGAAAADPGPTHAASAAPTVTVQATAAPHASAPAPAAGPHFTVTGAPLNTQLAAPIHHLVSGGEGTKTLIINVAPEQVGPVTVRANLTAEGVRIELFAPQDPGRDALRAMLGDLRRDLAGLGMSLGTTSLSVSDAEAPAQNSSQGPQGRGPDQQSGPGGRQPEQREHQRPPGQGPQQNQHSSHDQLNDDRLLRVLGEGLDLFA